jgi:para-aminobenzoate synthetase
LATIVIDNCDSFTYNLVHAVESITGRAPIVIRNDEKSWEEILALGVENIIVSPGPGRPDRAGDFGVSIDAIRYAQVPLLGVCLGHQGIAQAFGGRVVQAEPVHGRLAEVIHNGDELFAGIPQQFNAVRYHSLVVAEPLPEALRGIAWTADGTLMALRHADRPLWGVQFHPESILTEYGIELLRNFLGDHSLAVAARNEPPRHQLPSRDREGVVFELAHPPEDLFRSLLKHEPYAFWLDGWNGYSYMGTGSPEPPDARSGFHVGYFTYEGEACFVRAEKYLVIDHARSLVRAVGFDDRIEIVDRLDRGDESGPVLSGDKVTMRRCQGSNLSHNAPRNVRYRIPRGEYLELIRQCLDLIQCGESYEMCLTNQLLLDTDLPALDYYEKLRCTNPAPYAAYLQFGDTQIACSSPECFLRIDEHGRVESRPIKGTISRDRDPGELIDNERYRAENLMIVDLVRHDLSRVCEAGSVQVPRLMEVETYSTVHQLVSTITGQLRPGIRAMDCIRAAFPGGSMTGAPKKRTMELLADMERAPRGVYSGGLGYIDSNGAVDLNIVIRTAVFKGGEVSIGVGGAIVAQSDPAAEWDEMELKARALLEAFVPSAHPG